MSNKKLELTDGMKVKILYPNHAFHNREATVRRDDTRGWILRFPNGTWSHIIPPDLIPIESKENDNTSSEIMDEEILL